MVSMTIFKKTSTPCLWPTMMSRKVKVWARSAIPTSAAVAAAVNECALQTLVAFIYYCAMMLLAARVSTD